MPNLSVVNLRDQRHNSSSIMCRILSRTFPCLSPNIGLQNSTLLPLAKTVCVSVRKNSVDVSTDKK